MNSKEALDKLYMAVDEELLYEQSGYLFTTELTKVIEQDLDRLEKLEKENKELIRTQNVILLNSKDYILKNMELEKAIKIMKGKLVPILLLQEVDTLEEYNEGLDDCDEYRLTQEEFDLLKKVFESVGDKCE